MKEFISWEEHNNALDECAFTYRELGHLIGQKHMRDACMTAVENVPYITDERWSETAPITVEEYRKHVLAAIEKANPFDTRQEV